MEFKSKALKVDNWTTKNGQNVDTVYFGLPNGLSAKVNVWFNTGLVGQIKPGMDITVYIDTDNYGNATVKVRK